MVTVAMCMVLSQSLSAQKIFNITSDKLKRNVPVLVQEPMDYQSSKKYPLVYMLHGYSENHGQWNKTTDLNKLATDYQMILVCPEGFVNYYMNSPNMKDFKYEDFFFEELVPKMEGKYNVDNKNVFITGLSMGGYGALSLFIKHPDFFNAAASTSGALELDHENFKEISLKFFKSERMAKDLEMTLGNHKENDWNKFSISSLLEGNRDFSKGFYIDCGTEDPLLPSTLKIQELALSKKLPIRFSIAPGEHNNEYWARSIEYHFVYFKQQLKIE